MTGHSRVEEPIRASDEGWATIVDIATRSDVESVAASDTERVVELIGPSASHPSGPVRCVAIANTSDLVATGSDDTNIRVWHASDGQLAATYQAHRGRIHDIDFNAQGTILVSADEDGAAIWDTSSAHEPAVAPEQIADSMYVVKDDQCNSNQASTAEFFDEPKKYQPIPKFAVDRTDWSVIQIGKPHKDSQSRSVPLWAKLGRKPAEVLKQSPPPSRRRSQIQPPQGLALIEANDEETRYVYFSRSAPKQPSG